MNNVTDRIFADIIQKPADFIFDERVASVFPDMVKRSIPGYPAIIDMIETLTARYAQPETNLYDLGCSLGAASFAMLNGLKKERCKIIGIDSSSAMIEKCKKIPIKSSAPAEIEFYCADVNNFDYTNASVIILNFTLQFIEPKLRDDLLLKLASALRPGGILILSEKVKFDDEEVNELLIDVYHAFKKANGYSDLEISQKRTALENVLKPETIETHLNRLLKAGFKTAEVWFQCFNFSSMIAIK
ncbi:MAG: carboxy-S-adenosyl-L-methionine synthase CmoA [Candidatus Riflebacteria bacterium]|nr:carboxy-S-adenosyl-L-methionine synthase CmoA [Candidatus Riflebacteria bacterium]